MKYRNVKTGYILDTPCEIKGEDWEKLSPPSSSIKESKEEKKPAAKRAKK